MTTMEHTTTTEDMTPTGVTMVISMPVGAAGWSPNNWRGPWK
jgi:hypothetical protein